MFDVRGIIKQNMPEIKDGILKELATDPEFKRKFLNVLGVKEDIVILNGSDIKIEVVKR